MSVREQKELVVVGALIKDNERFLLSQRSSSIPEHDGKWEIPGGCIEYNETPENAVVREIKEELSIDIELGRLVPSVVTDWIESDEGNYKVFLISFEARILSGTPKPSEDEVAQVAWFAKDEIMKLETLPGIKEFIKAL